MTAGLARRVGAARVLDLGADPARAAELAALIEVHAPGEGDAAASLIVCDDPPREPERLAAVLKRMRELLETAPAALVSVADAVLAGEPEGWSAAEFTAALAAAGLEPVWTGLTDAHGSLGRRAGITCALAGRAGPGALEVLAGGPLGLRFDPALDSPPAGGAARVCIASYEFVGPTRTGGIGTAYTSLAEALAAAGQEVTALFTGWPDPQGEPLEWWQDHYRDRGIELVGLPSEPAPVETGHRHAARALQVYEWLRDRARPFDVVHFPEVLGHGYYATSAKRLGLALAESSLVLGTHSSTTWVLETNGTLTHGIDDFADDFIERGSVARADAVVSPSAYMLDWMRSRGWQLPERSFVQQYVRSAAAERFAAAAPPAGAESGAGEAEIVFFGRLEPRKGLRVFCDALDRLAEGRRPPRCRVTLLGKQSSIDGEPAGDWARRRAERWPWPVRLIDDFNQPQAVAYLRTPGRRLTVIPSLADNSPNTVYEALALRIPFIASRVGGTAELIDPRDLDDATFDPGDGGASGGDALAERISAALAAPKLAAPRPAVDADVCRDAHVSWHAALANAGERPPAARHSPTEPGPQVAVCNVGDGGDAPTHAESRADAEAVLFVADGGELRPGAVQAVRSALARSGAEIVALAIEMRAERGATLRVPVGGPPAAGLLRRCFGDGAFAVRAETLGRLGGFDATVAPELQAHHLLCRAAISGVGIEILPEALVSADAKRVPELELAVASRRFPELLEVYRGAPQPLQSELPLLVQQLWAAMRKREDDYTELYLHRFGRYSVQVRFFIHRFRVWQRRWERMRRRR